VGMTGAKRLAFARHPHFFLFYSFNFGYLCAFTLSNFTLNTRSKLDGVIFEV
jgi:hypothetical protein